MLLIQIIFNKMKYAQLTEPFGAGGTQNQYIEFASVGVPLTRKKRDIGKTGIIHTAH